MNYNNTAFWNRIAKRYANSPVSDEAAYRYKLERTQAFLRPDSDVLEFGCGTGSTALEHATGVRSYLATDLSPAMIEIAQGKLREKPIDGLSFRASTLEDLALEDESVDAILGLNILHLLEDVPGTVREAARLLKPGGVLVTSSACLRDTMPWFGPLGYVGSLLRLIPRVNMLRADDLVAAHEQAGLEIIERWQAKAGHHVLFLIARSSGRTRET